MKRERTGGQKLADFSEFHSFSTKNIPCNGRCLCAEQTKRKMREMVGGYSLDVEHSCILKRDIYDRMAKEDDTVLQMMQSICVY